MKACMIWAFGLAVSFILPAASYGQNLRISAQTTAGAQFVPDGGTVPFPSDGREVTLTFSMTNVGPTPLTVNQISLSAQDFSLTPPPLPATISSFGSLSFSIRFAPAAGRASTGTVSIQYTENNAGRTSSFNVSGAAPDLSFSALSPTGQSSPIASGGRLSFGAVRVGTPQTITILVNNRGGAPATLTGISVTGTDFSTTAAAPLAVAAGGTASIPIIYTPQARGLSNGAVQLTFGATVVALSLDGTGASPEFVTSYTLRADSNTRPLNNGSRVSFLPTPALTSSFADIAILNQGTLSGIVRAVTLTGSGFQLSGTPLLPQTVEPGGVLRFSIQFQPRQLGNYTGALRVELEDRTITAVVEGSTSAPQFSIAYIDPVSRNTVVPGDGGTIIFPSTETGSSSTFTIVLRNLGEGTGFVNRIAVTGGSFQLLEVPVLPATVQSGQDTRFTVRYSPVQRQNDVGALIVEFSGGTLTNPLRGSGIGADLVYTVIGSDGSSSAVQPGSEVAITAAVRQTVSTTIRVLNRGSADAQISTVTVAGTGFQITNVPFVPFVIRPNQAQTIDVAYTPAEPGVVRGRLRIGADEFLLTGNGVGARLEFSYTNEAGLTTLPENGTVLMTPTRVGQSSFVELSVQNTGTSEITISTIDIASASSVFALESSPMLPLNVGPGERIRFAVRFAPNNTGAVSGSLRVNNTTFALSGNGQQPVALPEVKLEGPSGIQAPLTQPTVGLTLAAPYSLPLRGTLTLSFSSDVFATNPAVQFATGGRTIAFTIPANSTRAVFETGSSEARLQTGTVAGSISLNASFSTMAGLEIQPPSPASLTMAISRQAPRLLSAEVGERSATGVVLIVSGYSTTRTLRSMDIQISTRGQQFVSTTLGVNLQPASLVWFEAVDSQNFGGLFSISVPIRLQRGGSQEDLVQYIESLSVTASNEVGASNAVSVAVR